MDEETEDDENEDDDLNVNDDEEEDEIEENAMEEDENESESNEMEQDENDKTQPMEEDENDKPDAMEEEVEESENEEMSTFDDDEQNDTQDSGAYLPSSENVNDNEEEKDSELAMDKATTKQKRRSKRLAKKKRKKNTDDEATEAEESVLSHERQDFDAAKFDHDCSANYSNDVPGNSPYYETQPENDTNDDIPVPSEYNNKDFNVDALKQKSNHFHNAFKKLWYNKEYDPILDINTKFRPITNNENAVVGWRLFIFGVELSAENCKKYGAIDRVCVHFISFHFVLFS